MPNSIPENELQRAFLIAKDAVFNVREYVDNRSPFALMAIRDCKRGLDALELNVDENLPAAITCVSESQARELIVYLQFVTDLKRVGDLLLWVAHRLPDSIAASDKKILLEMFRLIEHMLVEAYLGFRDRSSECVRDVLHNDTVINKLCSQFLHAHLKSRLRKNVEDTITILLISQALVRAGDHCTNLAEEVIRLIEQRSDPVRRHQPGSP